jgi:archaellum component FlaF (FlaF/FlaG flagellin family)
MISMQAVTRLLLAAVLLCSVAHAAEPEFRPTIVTASRTYDRQSSSFSIAGVSAGGTTVSVSRVTVALEGTLITGEWEPKTLRSTSATDLRRGTEVLAAANRNRLLLKLPDGSEVTAKIVKRERQTPPELASPTRD